MYLTVHGDSATLIQFFHSWLNEHGRKLDEWKQKIESDGDGDVAHIIGMIAERKDAVRILAGFVDHVQRECEIDPHVAKAGWLKSLFKRFEALQRETDYFESYHRLSGSSHITGEDTIMWLMALDWPEEHRRSLGREAWAYSVMMTRIASMFFVDAALECAIAYGHTDPSGFVACKQNLAIAIREISREAGVPIRD